MKKKLVVDAGRDLFIRIGKKAVEKCQGLVSDQDARPMVEALEPRLLLSGTPYQVDILDDIVANDGHLSLREAVIASNTNTALNEAAAGSSTYVDEITFSSSLFNNGEATINLTAGVLQISDNLALKGDALNRLILAGDTSSLVVQSGKSATIENIDFHNDLEIRGNVTLTNGIIDHNVTVTGGTLTVKGGLVLNGEIRLGGTNGSGSLYLSDSQTISGSGRIVFDGNTSSSNIYVNSKTTTLGTGITIKGGSQGGSINISFGILINQGNILEDVSGKSLGIFGSNGNFVNQGTVAAMNGGSLSINGLNNTAGHIVSISGGGRFYLSDCQNYGTIRSDDSIMSASGRCENNGTITSNRSKLNLILDSRFQNPGLISLIDTTLNLDGRFTIENLGNLSCTGGTVNLFGRLDNTGGTITLDDAYFSTWNFAKGGTIKGGILTAKNADHITSFNGTLDCVTVNTNLTVSSSSLFITNGLLLNGVISIEGSAYLRLDGTQTVSGTGLIVIDDNCYLYAQAGTITLDSGITVKAGSRSLSACIIISSGSSLINLGRIIEDESGKSFVISGDAGNFINQGTVSASNGGSLTINGLNNTAGHTVSINGGGILDLRNWKNDGMISSDSSTLTIDASCPNAGVINAADTILNLGGTFKLSNLQNLRHNGGSTNITGTLDNTDNTLFLSSVFTGPLVLSGTIQGGIIASADGTMIKSSNGTLNGVSLNSDIKVSGASLFVENGLTLNGRLTLEATTRSAYLYFQDTQILTGNGDIIFEKTEEYGDCFIYVKGDGKTPAILTIDTGITLHGNSNVSIRSYWSIDQVIDYGSIMVSSGASLDLNGPATFDDNIRISTQYGATVKLSGDLIGTTQNADLFTPLGITILDGYGTELTPQYLEAMGQDMGADGSGYKQNFAYGTLELGSNNYVKLVDFADNSAGSGKEAIYVNSLIVPYEATLDLNGFSLYSRVARIDGTIIGGTINQIQDSGVIRLNCPTPGEIASEGELDEWTFFGRADQSLTIAVYPGFSGSDPERDSMLDEVQISLLDSNGYIIGSATNSEYGQPVSLDNVTLPSDGTYRIQIQAPDIYNYSTGIYTIVAWELTAGINTLTMNQQKTGNIEYPLTKDKWIFSGIAGQQIRFDLINTSGPGLVLDLSGPNGWSGFTGIAADSDLITLPLTGRYTLTAHAPGGQYGISYAFKISETSQTILTPGDAYNGTLAGSGQAQIFKIDLEKSSPLQLTLDDSSSSDHTELYVKMGSAPTRADYDFSATDISSSDQKLFIPMATAGTCYVLVYGNSIPAISNYTLTATAIDLVLNSITPDHAGNNSDTVITLTGAGFVTGTTVELVDSNGNAYSANNTEIDSFTQMTSTFSAGAVPAGTYTVLVIDPSGATASFANAFKMAQAQSGQAHLETNLIVPAGLGRHATATIYIEYANTGDMAMAAPLLVLGSGDPDGSDMPLLTLDKSLLTQGFWTSAMPEGFSTSIQILASGVTPGVLQPGEKNRIPVYYAGLLNNSSHRWDFSDSQIEFNLGVLTADDTTPVDWSSMKNSMKPESMESSSWDSVWKNFVSQTGSNWGDYVAMLDSNAAYLGRLGESVTDISKLLAFEFSQAVGLGPVKTFASSVDAAVEAPGISISFSRFFAGDLVSRSEAGILGEGWSYNWDYSLSTESDGTITINGPGGSIRTFQPDSRETGVYFSQPGDYGKLTQLNNGLYTLTEADGSFYAFTSNGKLEYVQDTNNNRITCGYTDGKLTSLTHSSGQSIQISYNAAGLIQSVTDSTGRATTYTYDSGNKHLLSVTDYTGNVTSYTYNTTEGSQSENALTTITYVDGTHQYFTYDNEGRLSSAYLDGDAQKVSYSYDDAGTVYVTNALGSKNTLYYDYRGLLLKSTDALGNSVASTFDSTGNLISITDTTGHSTFYGYDKNGNMVRATDAMGHNTTFTYTSSYNRLASLTDANGNTTAYGYDANGNQTSITYANGSVEHWDYNSNGTPADWVNCRGSETDFAYDNAGRIIKKTYADGTSTSYTYDTRGNLLTSTDTTGAKTTYTYNTIDELVRIDYPAGQYLIFTYDVAGRRTSSTDQLGHKVIYSYNAVGQLARVTDENGATIAAYSYDVLGQLTRKELCNGVYTTYSYDAAGRLLSLVNHDSANAVISSFDYTYDTLGRRTSMTTMDGVWAYSYDDIGELIHAVFTSKDPQATANQDLRYVYDAMGNRIKTIENGVTTTYTVNNMNQYTKVGDTTYYFDADGNLTKEVSPSGTTTCTYNSDNRMTAISSPEGNWQYGYDALGNRVSSSTNGVVTNYIIDPAGLGNIVGTYDDQENIISRYTYGYGLLSGISGINTSYYTFDALGSTSELTSATGAIVATYKYAPFGAVLSHTGANVNPFQFVGEAGVMNDGTGLDYMRARQYSAGIGRFLCTDPIGILGGMNVYRYVDNGATNSTDPKGLFKFGSRSLHVLIWIPGLSNDQDLDSLNIELSHEHGFFEDGSGENAGYHGEGTGVFSEDPTNENYIYDPEHYDDSLMRQALNNVLKTGEWTANDYRAMTHNCQDFADALRQEYQRLASHLSLGVSRVSNSSDPNDLIGPAGYGSNGYISSDTITFSYRIDFENESKATAPAQQVTITNQLNTNLDWSTFELTEISFGDTIITVPKGRSHFETTVSMTYNGQTFDVQIEAGIDYLTGKVFALFQSLDPETSLPPDVLTGFLPPENGTGRGMGYVSYIIDPKQGLATGTRITNIALISFDGQPWIATNQVDPHDPSKGTDPAKEALNTIDAGGPASAVTQLASEIDTESFLVEWSGHDDANGSGIANYDIYVSTDGGNFTLWKDKTTETSATFIGEFEHTYSFYSIARDNVGHVETKTVADTGTSLKDHKPQSIKVSASEIIINEGQGGTFTVQLSKKPAADVTVTISRTSGDGSITTDLSTLTFTAQNWNAPQTITLNTLADNNVADSSATFTISSADLDDQTLIVNAKDTDVQSLVVSESNFTMVEGETVLFGVSLAYKPSAPVTVTVSKSSGDAGLSANGSTLTFTAENWNTSQQVTISSQLDMNLTDSSAVFTVSSQGLPDKTISVKSYDADTTTMIVLPASLQINEGGSGTFFVRLTYKPDVNVTVSIVRVSGDGTITANAATLTFTQANWNIMQQVTVSAPADANSNDSSAVFKVSVPTYRSQQLAARQAQMGRLMNLPRVVEKTVTVTAQDVEVRTLAASSKSTASFNKTFAAAELSTASSVSETSLINNTATNAAGPGVVRKLKGLFGSLFAEPSQAAQASSKGDTGWNKYGSGVAGEGKAKDYLKTSLLTDSDGSDGNNDSLKSKVIFNAVESWSAVELAKSQTSESSLSGLIKDETSLMGEAWDAAALSLMSHSASKPAEPMAVTQEMLDEWGSSGKKSSANKRKNRFV